MSYKDLGNQPTPLRKNQPEDEIEKLVKQPLCMHCKKERVLLHLLPHRKKEMRVCVNKNCFKYANLSAIKTWVV